ncbi:MAG TPA: PAS domain S-box protein [bacterium]|nr:PAS domain S-box protein [bacterium]HPR86776.1 PAS domain S-box protein [bacterium]
MQFDYQELIESVQDMVFAVSRSGKLIYCNRQFAAFAGRSKSGLRAFPLLDLVHPPDRPRVELLLRETCKGAARSFEARFLSPEGVPFYFSTNMTPIVESGHVTGAVGISRDINERMMLEQQITELKNFQESILKSMQAGLITVDLLGRITSFNAGAEEVLKFSALEALGLPLAQVVGEEAARIFLRQAPRGDFPTNREMPLKTRAGYETDIGFTVTPLLDDNGAHAGTILSFKDISAIKRMQAEVMRMDRLASLGVLASGIAHEIKNPLAGIKAMAQTLQQDVLPRAESFDYLERIVRQVNRLDELLKTFFDYARPRPPQRKRHRIQDILHEVMTLVDKRLQEHGIRFISHIPADAPPIFADFHQIQQVILNLIINAIDAMEEGGELVIRAQPSNGAARPFSAAKAAPPRAFVEITVADSGIGIPEENLEIIFDPFYTTKAQGTGLGLSIVYRIIAAHDGEITVSSRVGEGTTFRVLLPTEEERR